MDYYPGGELFLHLSKGKVLNEKYQKLYFAEVLAGIEFLHKNNILYRDLKP
jgi:serine/threonine protein kinase